MYAVVKFLDESGAQGVVCTHWISDDESICLYPNVRTNEARDKLLQRLANPDLDWSLCRVQILNKYSNFSSASQHLHKAEDSSDSEDETIYSRPRKRMKTCFIYPEEESEEDSKLLITQKSFRKSRNVSILHSVPTSDPHPIPSRTFQFQPRTPPLRYSIPRIASNSQVPSDTPDAHSQSEKPVSSYLDQTIINGKLISFMADMSVKLKEMEAKIDLILENQAKLLSTYHQMPKNTENLENLDALGSLPVVDDGSFMDLNEKISKERHLRQMLIKVLISVGGKDLRCHIHNMLRRVLSDEVAELYNLSGKSNSKNTVKKSFLTTEVSKIIFSACQRVFKDLATEVNVKEAVGDWLHQAKVRKTRRMERQEKNSEKNTELFQPL